MQNRPFNPRPLRFPPPCAKPVVLPTAAAVSRLPCAKPPALPPGRGVFPRPGCETARSAPGRGGFPPPVCETARSARGRCFSPRSGCETGRSTPGRWISPPHLLPPRHPDRPCAAASPRLPLPSRLVPAPPPHPVFPYFPATPWQNVVAIPFLPTFRSVWSRCLRRDETAVFPGFCAVSVLEKGRDCCFSGVMCGLGAREGTRLLFFRGFMRSRCLRWDETAAFPGFYAVSVLEKGRDCCFSGVLCGLGAGEGTRLSFFRDFAWSRCLGWDETAVFPGFCAVSVPEKGRDCRFSGILRGLGAWDGTRLLFFRDFVWSRC